MTTITQKVLQSGSGVSIDRLALINGIDFPLNLNLVFVELNLFEDIFSSTISGTLLIEDALNLLDGFSICGQEWLVINISKPGFENTKDGSDVSFSMILRVYKVEKVVNNGSFSQQYLIHLCKEEHMISHKRRVSKSYVTTLPEVAIKDIFMNHLEYNEDIFKTAFATWPMNTSALALSCVIPNLHPFDAINYLTSLARGTNNINDYMFFENTAGYNFKSLSEMFKANQSLNINFRVKNIVTSGEDASNDPYTNSLAPIKVETDVLFDQMLSTMHGEFGVQADYFDMSRQMYVSKGISYKAFLNDYKKEDTLNRYSKVPKNDWNDYIEDASVERIPYYRIFHPITKAVSHSAESFATEALATRIMQIVSITTHRVKLHMPGTPLLKAGDTIKLNYPSFRARGHDDSSEDLLDRYLAAKYLITSVRHVIRRDEWNSYCELSKDTLPTDLPERFAQKYSIEGL